MKKNYPSRAANVPVTQKMLYAVRDELNSSISALDAKVDSRFHQLTAQIHQMKILCSSAIPDWIIPFAKMD